MSRMETMDAALYFLLIATCHSYPKVHILACLWRQERLHDDQNCREKLERTTRICVYQRKKEERSNRPVVNCLAVAAMIVARGTAIYHHSVVHGLGFDFLEFKDAIHFFFTPLLEDKKCFCEQLSQGEVIYPPAPDISLPEMSRQEVACLFLAHCQ